MYAVLFFNNIRVEEQTASASGDDGSSLANQFICGTQYSTAPTTNTRAISSVDIESSKCSSESWKYCWTKFNYMNEHAGNILKNYVQLIQYLFVVNQIPI